MFPLVTSGLLEPCLRVSVTIIRRQCSIRCVSTVRLLFPDWHLFQLTRARPAANNCHFVSTGNKFPGGHKHTSCDVRYLHFCFLMRSVYCYFLVAVSKHTGHNCLQEGSQLNSTMQETGADMLAFNSGTPVMGISVLHCVTVFYFLQVLMKFQVVAIPGILHAGLTVMQFMSFDPGSRHTSGTQSASSVSFNPEGLPSFSVVPHHKFWIKASLPKSLVYDVYETTSYSSEPFLSIFYIRLIGINWQHQ